jgi:hypothetical protein
LKITRKRTAASHMTPAKHRDSLAKEFFDGFIAKYDKGQAEHGGHLWEKDCSTFLTEEVYDFWAYARTIEMQRREAVQLLDRALFFGSYGCPTAELVARARAVLVGTRKDKDQGHVALARAMRAGGR